MSAHQALVHELLPARGEPAGALVLLHGRGSDEHDLIPLAHALDPARRLVGVLPRGPLSLPPGGAHWYAVARVGFPEPGTFHETYQLLIGWLDGLEGLTGVPIERTILGGFSQGTVMSYALGLGRGRPSPAGILALSGFIPTVHDFELDLSSRAGLPVLIAHGARDPVIDVEFGRDAERRLSAA
ncbi:MAG TPA: phospholipase, partial [Solirubrobacteraceae bacterium]|nr:phospholipase [Solirubrobacteraceae bacterium]